NAEAIADVSSVELIELGRTPHYWLRPLRPMFRTVQRNLFRTEVMLPLAIAGLLILALCRKWREMLFIVAIPAYFLCFQSSLFTEYRYILAIHYFIPVLVAVTIYLSLMLVVAIARGGHSREEFRMQSPSRTT